MRFAWFVPDVIVLAINVAVAAVAFSLMGFVIGKQRRLAGLPLQHGLLCAVVILTLFSPAPIWLAQRYGMGLIPIGVAPSRKPDAIHVIVMPKLPKGDFDRGLPQPITSVHSAANQAAPALDIHDAAFADTSPSDDQPGVLPTPSVDMLPQATDSATKPVDVSTFQIVASQLILLWGTIALWFGCRLVRGLNVVRRIQCSLAPSADVRVIEAARVAFSAAGFDSNAAVYESTLVPAPSTIGCWRSSIVIPRGLADVLDNDQLACILAHEVAHVMRRDTLMALLQQFAAALFWWNPLLRVVNRQINQLRERLCDDCVVMRYGTGVPLAESIVQVAQWSSTRMAASPLSLALLEDFHDLENRIHRLTEQNRAITTRLNRRSATVLCAFSMILGGALMLPLVRAQDRKSEPKVSYNSQIPANEAQEPGERKQNSDADDLSKSASEEAEPTALIDVFGHVRTEEGKPVAAAVVSLFPINLTDPTLGTTTTDTRGAYRFGNVPLPMDISSPGLAPCGSFQIFCEAEEFGIAWHGTRHYCDGVRPTNSPRHREDFSLYRGELIELNLTMRKAKSLKGRIVDEEGNPVADATIDLRGFDYLDTATHEYHPNFREFWLLFSEENGECVHAVPEKYHVATSDADGRFEIQNLSDETVANVQVSHPQFADQFFWAAITDRPITEYRYVSGAQTPQQLRRPNEVPSIDYQPVWKTRKVLASPVEIQVIATRRVVVTVVHGEERHPVKSARFWATSTTDSLSTAESGETDDQGHAVLNLPPGTYQLVVNPPRDTDFVSTNQELVVNRDGTGNPLQMRINDGCVVIFEAVDRDSGVGIPYVSFWWETSITDGHVQGQTGQTSLQAQLAPGAPAVTNEIGELRAVVPAGTWRYGAPWGPVEGYDVGSDFGPDQWLECTAAKTIRAKFIFGKADRKVVVPAAAPFADIQAADSHVMTNSIGMKLVEIPAGEFMMGAEEDRAETLNRFPYCDPEWLAGQGPRHNVRITRSFDMGQFEVTLQQFQQFYQAANFKMEIERDGKSGWGYGADGKPMESNKYRPWNPVAWTPASDHPAIYVTWNDAVAFCQWLSHREGRTYRLPTEAEWEYACRAGSNHRYSFGDDWDQLSRYGNTCDQDRKSESEKRGHQVMLPAFDKGMQTDKQIPFPYLSHSDGYAFTAPVGKYLPNAFGLYDMHGNAQEWCSDWYSEDYYSRSTVDDPQGPSAGQLRVVRGGGFDNTPLALRCAHRTGEDPSLCLRSNGFRVVRVR